MTTKSSIRVNPARRSGVGTGKCVDREGRPSRRTSCSQGAGLPPSAARPNVFGVNWHQVIDERSYEMHRVIASILRRNPSELQKVVEWIAGCLDDPEYSTQSKDALQDWLRVIETRGLAGVLEILEDRGEAGVQMRQSSPFAVLMPQEERMGILRRYEARRTRTHPAGV